MDRDLLDLLRRLLASPVAALGTLHDGAPSVSMVPLVAAPDRSGFLIHVSRLAQHTRDLEADPRISLLFMAPLVPETDPLALPRVTVQATAMALSHDSEAYAAAAPVYLDRFPSAELTLGLGDFSFFLLQPTEGRLVAGFGRALSLDRPQLLSAL